MSAITAATDSQPFDVQPARQPHKRGPCSLSEAVAAVTEHCLQTELRRLKAVQERIASEFAPPPDASAETLQLSPMPAPNERPARRPMPKPALRPRAQAWPPPLPSR